MNLFTPDQIRNVAIVAHIDHGKTTLLDALLKQANIFRDNEKVPERALDSNAQEQERGITIFAKHTSLYYNDYKINLIDTPGHADFSGEVERILGMVGSVLLLVDAQEGPMPQTRFVLSAALKMGICPIVVLNKIDKPNADPDHALNETFDLFVELGANDEQLDFAYAYASGIGGFAMKEVGDPRDNMTPLFDLMVDAVPAPPGSLEVPFVMQAATLSYSEFVGRQATGRILEGTIKKNDSFHLITPEGKITNHKITQIEGYLGLQKIEMDEAGAGDIVSIAGAPEIMIGDTLSNLPTTDPLPPIDLSEPTLSIDITVNSSPFAGQDGKHVTMNKIRDRLEKERRANISLVIEEIGDEVMRVSGRGELHLSILVEAMRREGFELTLAKPKVIIKDGNEPLEATHIEVPEEFSGAVIEGLSKRRGEMKHLATNEHGLTEMEFLVPTRGLIGYRNHFLTITKGKGVLSAVFDCFAPMKGDIPKRQSGALTSMNKGRVTGYACFALQDRGTLFVKPGDEVYEGMVVGENARDNDLKINITKEKQLTNFRTQLADENVMLTPPKTFTLEEAIDFIEDDELIEVTPNHVRIRKRSKDGR
ncbi:MAG: GTP-binding protein TypA/BipA [Chlamydiia bacterium]|nr:GTP-binding protein TypA/BipA [Chlamydiia bacterium]MCH9615430.1 GTP-binding protein TypA/BipA [Chlamydiia bacterium]MCH9628248.1 GTP-binding protein TypA/BipA [Chlamydiia bacterium]